MWDTAAVLVILGLFSTVVLLLVIVLIAGAGRLWQYRWVADLQIAHLQARLADERADRDDWKNRYFAEIDRK